MRTMEKMMDDGDEDDEDVDSREADGTDGPYYQTSSRCPVLVASLGGQGI